jgi:hypothetical protein
MELSSVTIPEEKIIENKITEEILEIENKEKEISDEIIEKEKSNELFILPSFAEREEEISIKINNFEPLDEKSTSWIGIYPHEEADLKKYSSFTYCTLKGKTLSNFRQNTNKNKTTKRIGYL